MQVKFSRSMALALALILAAPLAAPAGEISLPLAGRIQKPVRSFQEMRRSRVVQQRWDLSCGAAALSTLLSFHYGDKVSEAAVIASLLHHVNPQKVRARGGFSLLDLKRYVEARGYKGSGYSGLTLEELASFATPAIVPVRINNYDHFVVFRSLRGKRIVLADPSHGALTMKMEEFQAKWKNGIGFLVLRPDAPPPPAHLTPSEEDFFIPDGNAMIRSLLRTGTSPLTRSGL